MLDDLFRLVNALKWVNITDGGAKRKEIILLNMRALINNELKKIRLEQRENGGE